MKTLKLVVSLGILVVGVALALAAQSAWAKGPPECSTISGPGLNGLVKVTDASILKGFALMEFENFNKRFDTPPAVQGGYQVTNYFSPDCSKQPFDQWTYYANPAGGSGYVYYDGIVNGWSAYDRHWYAVTARGDVAMVRLLSNFGVAPARAQTASSGAAMPVNAPETGAPARPTFLWPALGAALLLTGTFLFRRFTRTR